VHVRRFPVGIVYLPTRKRKKNTTVIRLATACCLHVALFWKRAAAAAVMHETGRANWGLGAGSESRMVLVMREKRRSSSCAPEVRQGSVNPANTRQSVPRDAWLSRQIELQFAAFSRRIQCESWRRRPGGFPAGRVWICRAGTGLVSTRPCIATRHSNCGFGLRHPLLHRQSLSTQRRDYVGEHDGHGVRKSPGEILG
jgi:hypothetical protein